MLSLIVDAKLLLWLLYFKNICSFASKVSKF